MLLNVQALRIKMFFTQSNNNRLFQAIEKANNILFDEVFLGFINNKGSFDMATCSSSHIAQLIIVYRELEQMEIVGYHKKLSRALAYFDKRYPNKIFINTAKINRSLGSIVATYIHEYIHLLDNIDKTHYFGHGDNKRKGKENTAPYWIDNLAQSLIDGIEDFNNTESSKIISKRWWQFWK